MVQTLLMFRVKKMHQLTKKSGTNFLLALSWAKDDPQKEPYVISSSTLPNYCQIIDCDYPKQKNKD